MRHDARYLRTVLALPVILMSGCGGSAERFSGDRDVPAGFEIAQGAGASFAYPSGWTTANSLVGPRKTRVTTASAPAAVGDATPTIQLRRTGDLNGSFDNLVEARNSVAQGSGANREEEREDVEVAGAERGVLFRGQVSFGEARYESFDLSILASDGTGLFFSGVVPADVDADAILESLRLDTSK